MHTVMDAQDSQEELLRRAQQGDPSAFETLLNACEGELEKYIGARLGDHLSARIEAADVRQETCARAWESIRQVAWTGNHTFVRWLKGIARHVILQQADRHQRRGLIYVEHDRSSDEVSPSRGLRREERFDRLQDALDHLPPDYRRAVALVRIEGLQIKEAAERMGRTPKAVTHLLSRGLKQLKGLVGDTESLLLPPRRLKGGAHDDT